MRKQGLELVPGLMLQCLQVLPQLLEMGARIAACTRQEWTGAHICAIRGCSICLQVTIGLCSKREKHVKQ